MKKIKKSMNKNCKLFIIVLTIILSIIVSGCTPIDGGGTQFTMKDLRKGNKGLEIKFIKDAPPNVVFENDPNILIALSVENLGASDIKNGVISIGVEEDYMSINEINFNNEDKTDLIVFDLEGKSIDNPIGGYAPLEIYTTSKDISLSRLQDTSARIFSCYDYQTILEESICLDPVEIRKDMSSKACVGGNFAPGTQGAPVNVKKVDVLSKRITGNKVRHIFRIKVGNDGRGNVIIPGISEEMCSNKELDSEKRRRVFDLVKVKVKLGIDNIKCRNNGVVKLTNGKLGETICEIDTTQLGEYVTSLVIQLDYGYMFNIARDFKIEKIG